MGLDQLDITHDCYHGAVNAFNSWRYDLAELAGYLPDLEGLEPLFRKHVHNTDLRGLWYAEPEDPLCYLLLHSSYDGGISFKHCVALADRLEELNVWLVPGDSSMSSLTTQFIAGLRSATQAGLSVWYHHVD